MLIGAQHKCFNKSYIGHEIIKPVTVLPNSCMCTYFHCLQIGPVGIKAILARSRSNVNRGTEIMVLT